MTAPQDSVTYPLLPDSGADAFEQELLGRWEAEQLFEQVQAARAGAKPFVFYEGPPTANGRPGIHHVLSRTIKDLFCRYKTLKGFLALERLGLRAWP